MKKHLSLFLLMISSISLADINMKDAAFLTRHNEFSNPLLEKKYSSRSLWQGAFGFGWCARFESRLQLISENQAVLQRCDRRLQVTLLKKNKQFIYQSPTGVELYDSEGRLTDHLPSQSRLFYDLMGRLTRIESPDGPYFLTYQLSSDLVEKISSISSAPVTYTYERGNLQIISKVDALIRFQYDDFHNLTKLQSPHREEKITYRTHTDEILTYESSPSGCRSIFDFRKMSATLLKSTVEKKCGSNSQRSAWIFRARRTPQNRLILSDVQITGDLNERQALP